MNPDSNTATSKIPPSVIRFSERELELAHQMAALGIEWTPSPGMFLYDGHEALREASPLQPHVYILLNYTLFIENAADVERFKKEWTWLPTWTEARAWLRAHGRSEPEVLDRVRERVGDDGVSDLEALYEQMVAILKAERETPPTAV